MFFPFAQSRELLIPGLIIPDDIVHLRDQAITGSDPTFLEKLTYNANDNYSSQAVQSARNDHVHVRSFNDEPVSSSTLFFNYRANILFLSSSSSSSKFLSTNTRDARDASFSKRFTQTSLCLDIDCVIMREPTRNCVFPSVSAQ